MTETALDGWVVVSGACGSLGSAFTDHFAAAHRSVLAIDKAFAKDVTSGTRLAQAAIDLTDAQAVDDALAAHIPVGARIALLVNAAGLIWNEPVITLKSGKFRPHGVDSWQAVIDANLTGPFVLATRIAARMARQGGGAIVNFSSVSAQGQEGQIAYGAAKAGIEGMTRAMARELGPLGIRVNAIAPGFIDVASTRAAVTPEQLSSISARTPLQRLGGIADLLSAVDLLATNSFITGAVLDVGGGLRA
jgi:3-oxoacyl-[acyl-carrier protein] reductase